MNIYYLYVLLALNFIFGQASENEKCEIFNRFLRKEPLYNCCEDAAIGCSYGHMGNITFIKLIPFLLDYRIDDTTIPPEFGNYPEVVELDLSGNNFIGSIPPELGNLTDLVNLDLSGNDLSGTIPHELGNLSYLRELNLYGNNLSGPLPPELGKLSNLKELGIEKNICYSLPQEVKDLIIKNDIHDTNISKNTCGIVELVI